jgi:hypothetical protein
MMAKRKSVKLVNETIGWVYDHTGQCAIRCRLCHKSHSVVAVIGKGINELRICAGCIRQLYVDRRRKPKIKRKQVVRIAEWLDSGKWPETLDTYGLDQDVYDAIKAAVKELEANG